MQITRIELDQDIIQCPHCGALYIVTDLTGGVKVRCRSFGEIFTVSESILLLNQ